MSDFNWMSQDLSKLKVGDDVYCLLHGRSKVIDIGIEASSCRIKTKDSQGYEHYYNSKGQLSLTTKSVNQCLFPGKHHPFNPQPNPLGLQVGDTVDASKDKCTWYKDKSFLAYVPDIYNPWIVIDNKSGEINRYGYVRKPQKEITVEVTETVTKIQHVNLTIPSNWDGTDKDFEELVNQHIDHEDWDELDSDGYSITKLED